MPLSLLAILIGAALAVIVYMEPAAFAYAILGVSIAVAIAALRGAP